LQISVQYNQPESIEKVWIRWKEY